MTTIQFTPAAWNNTAQTNTPYQKQQNFNNEGDSFTCASIKAPSGQQGKEGIVLKLLKWVLGDTQPAITQEEALAKALSVQEKALQLKNEQHGLILRCAQERFEPTQTPAGNFVWIEDSGKYCKTIVEYDKDETPYRRTTFSTKNLRIRKIEESIPDSDKVNKIVFFDSENLIQISNGAKRGNSTDFAEEFIIIKNGKPYSYALDYENDSKKTYAKQSFCFQKPQGYE